MDNKEPKVKPYLINYTIKIGETYVGMSIVSATSVSQAEKIFLADSAFNGYSHNLKITEIKEIATGVFPSLDLEVYIRENAVEILKLNDIIIANDKPPIIDEDGTWLIYDYENKQYIDTNKPSTGAEGKQGVGIKTIVGNPDGSWTITYDNDSSVTISNEAYINLQNQFSEVINAVENKQDRLVSGVNIKTINNQSILGEGNFTLPKYDDSEIKDSIQSNTNSINSINNKVGKPNGLATLDSKGKIRSSQLPDGIDEILEFNDFNSLPVVGESNKIYVTLDDGKTYRWSGTQYTEISPSIALGETYGTAYEGYKGKQNADDIKKLNTNFEELSTKVANTSGWFKWENGKVILVVDFYNTSLMSGSIREDGRVIAKYNN